jgi:hypothetical protein
MKRNRHLIAFSPDGDLIEKAMAQWVPWCSNYLVWTGCDVTRLTNVKRTSLHQALTPSNRIDGVVFYGHGRRVDGAFLDSQGRAVLDKNNVRLVLGKYVCAFSCYSAKLAEAARNKGPTSFLGFRNEHWLVISGGEAVEGFEECSRAAVVTMALDRDAGRSMKRLQQVGKRYATKWFFRQVTSVIQFDMAAFYKAFVSLVALLNNITEVRHFES